MYGNSQTLPPALFYPAIAGYHLANDYRAAAPTVRRT